MTNSRRWIGTIAVAALAAWIPSVGLAQAAPKLAPARPNVTILATGGTIAGAQPKPGEAGYKAGSFSVESIFSPVKRVNWEVTSARVGQSTAYDKLILEVWTDGTISPERSLSTAAKLIIDHLRYIAGVSEETLSIAIEKEVSGSRLTSELADTPVEALDLSVRVFNSLKRTGITTVGDVLDLLEKGETAVMSIRNFGEKSLDELRQKMREKGYMKDETNSAE